VGSIEIPVSRMPDSVFLTKPDGFKVGERVFVWSSKHQQYREPTLVDVAPGDPVIRNLFERKENMLKSGSSGVHSETTSERAPKGAE
jgi:hypothetical protein